MKINKIFFIFAFVLLVSFFGTKPAFAQDVTLWEEDFGNYYQATTRTSDWFTSGTQSYAVQQYLLLTVVPGYISKWEKTSSIDVSAYDSVNLSFLITPRYKKGDLTFYYRFDDEDWSNVRTFRVLDSYQNISDFFTPFSVSGKTKLFIKIEAYGGVSVNAGQDRRNVSSYSIDNIKIYGKPRPILPKKVLWLKADAGVPISPSTITRWDDQSGSANNANSNNSNSYVNNSLNFNPGIKFNYTNKQFMSVNDHYSLRSKSVSIFSVINPQATNYYDAIVSKHGTAYNGFGYGLQYFPDGDHVKFVINPETSRSYNFTYPYNSATIPISLKPHIIGATYDESIIKIFSENDENSYSYTNGIIYDVSPLAIGADHTDVNAIDILDGDINEVIIYNYAVTDLERKKVESYLAIKYGITLNHDYIFPSGGIMYAIDNAYKYDIAGLANYSGPDINQRISSSSNKANTDGSNLIISLDNDFNGPNNNIRNSLPLGSSIVWAKNNVDKSSWIMDGDYKHVAERWKINVNSATWRSYTYFQFNLAGYPAVDGGKQYYLLIDNDETTANGVVQEIPLTKSGDFYSGYPILPTGISYFSIGYKYPFVASLNRINNVSTYGGSNGEILINADGGSLPYNYDVKLKSTGTLVKAGTANSVGLLTISALQAGLYTVSIKDARGIIINIDATITQPEPPLTYRIKSIKHVSVPSGNDGKVEIEILSGAGIIYADLSGLRVSISNNIFSFGGLTSSLKDLIIWNANSTIRSKIYIKEPKIIPTTNTGNVNECVSSGSFSTIMKVDKPIYYCLDLTKNSNHLHIANQADINVNSSHPLRTVMFWFKTSDISSNQFLYKEGGTVNGLGIYILKSSLYFDIWNGSTSSGAIKTDLIRANTWHNVTLTWNQSAEVGKRLSAYLDGTLINSINGLDLINHPGENWIGGADQAVLFDNQQVSGGATSYVFRGLIDDFKMWNACLTNDDIVTELKNPAVGTNIASLIANYDFNSINSTNIVNDLSTKGYNAQLKSASDIVVPVSYSSPFSIEWKDGNKDFERNVSVSGIDDYSYSLTDGESVSYNSWNDARYIGTGDIRLAFTDANKYMTSPAKLKHPCKGVTPADGSIELRVPCAMTFAGNPTKQRIDCGSKFMDNVKAFTMESWLRFDMNDMNKGSRHSFFGQDDALEFGIYNVSPVQFHIWSSRGGGAYFPLSTYPNDLKWHHLAIVGTGLEYIFYVDGVLIARRTNTDVRLVGYGEGHATSNNVYIGSSVFDGVRSASNSYKGDMYKVGFWNRALSNAELKNIFDNNPDYVGNENGLIAGYNFYEATGDILNPAGEGNPHIANIDSGDATTSQPLPVWADFKYNWSNGAKTKKIMNLGPGVYEVEVELAEGCKLNRSYTLKEASAALTVDVPFDPTVCVGAELDISAKASGSFPPYKYEYFMNGLSLGSNTKCVYPLERVGVNNTAGVQVIDENGCTTNAVKTVSVFAPVVTKTIIRLK